MKPRLRKPVHYAFYGEPAESACRLRGGRNGQGYERRIDAKGKAHWAPVPSDIPYGRLTVKLVKVTCEDCLVVVIRRVKKQLHERLRLLESTVKLRMIVRRAHARTHVSGLRKLVGV